MQKFEFHETEIHGLVEIISFSNGDERGEFIKDYSQKVFEENGISHPILETFYSVSQKGVLRGMHFQRVKQQAKLVRCVYGKVYDVVVDLRPESPTFKKWLAFELTGENKKELLVPTGCAHGFLALEESMVAYKCSENFYGEFDGGIVWNDPELSINWGLERIGGAHKLIVSEKDNALPTYKEFVEKFGRLA